VEGTDEQVEMALRTVEDEGLFFEHTATTTTTTTTTTTVLPEHSDSNIPSDSNSNIGLSFSIEDDATRDGAAVSVATYGETRPRQKNDELSDLVY